MLPYLDCESMFWGETQVLMLATQVFCRWAISLQALVINFCIACKVICFSVMILWINVNILYLLPPAFSCSSCPTCPQLTPILSLVLLSFPRTQIAKVFALPFPYHRFLPSYILLYSLMIYRYMHILLHTCMCTHTYPYTHTFKFTFHIWEKTADRFILLSLVYRT